jgi:ApbE superfamily uncharacterized protein (UPF0280 family)
MIRRIHFEVRETAMTVVADEEYLKEVKDAVFEAREIIEAKIWEDPFFGMTYDPYEASEKDDLLIRRMCGASQTAGVGPMASVAGAVAACALERIYAEGCRYAILDNGGDIAICSDRDVVVGINQNNPKLPALAFRIPAREGMFSVCSSSGRIGPSVSFGESEIAVVFADDPVLADACATAAGNLTGDCSSESVSFAARSVSRMKGVDGCAIFCGDSVALHGDVPELVMAEGGEITNRWLPPSA